MEDIQITGDSEGFTPEEFADVQESLRMLFAVRAGSQPMDRDFGIDFEGMVDYPEPVARNVLSVEITDKVGKYEPRVEIDDIIFTTGEDGQMIPHVHFIKNDNYEEETEE